MFGLPALAPAGAPGSAASVRREARPPPVFTSRQEYAMTACTVSPSGEDLLALAALTWLAEDATPRHLRPLTQTHGAAKALGIITAGQFPGGLSPQARTALERARRHLRAVPGRDELAAIFQSG
jgi:hypothetical protein